MIKMLHKRIFASVVNSSCPSLSSFLHILRHQMAFCSSPAILPFTGNNGEPDLWTFPVTLRNNNGPPARIDLVFQDIRPSPSGFSQSQSALAERTVVMVHGSPGSHKDFKYVVPLLTGAGIRAIGVNWPGMGYSGFHPSLQGTNDERDRWVQALLDRLHLQKPLIFLGHSRGAENALRLAAKNSERTVGCVLANPTGFRQNRAVRPWFLTKLAARLWLLSPRLQRVLAPVYKKVYDRIGLRTSDGHFAARALCTMTHMDFGRQRQFVDLVEANAQLRVLIAHSGQDPLMEPEVNEEFVQAFGNCRKLLSESQGDDDQIIESITKLINNGTKNVSVFFPKEGHFLQKYRAKILAETIKGMFEATERGIKLTDFKN